MILKSYIVCSLPWHDFTQTAKDKCPILSLKSSSGEGCVIFIEPKTLPLSGTKVTCFCNYLSYSLLYLWHFLTHFLLELLCIHCFFFPSNLLNSFWRSFLGFCSPKPVGTVGFQKPACSHETSHPRIYIKASPTNHRLSVGGILVRLGSIWKRFSQLVLSSFEVFRNKSYLSW